jgi:glycerophosphoryl diester phosphodiesterase
MRQSLLLATFGQEALFSPAFQALQIPEEHKGRRLLTPSLVAAAHRRGLKVIPWTINREADMRRLLSWGVDGLNTDYPDRLLTVLLPVPR